MLRWPQVTWNKGRKMMNTHARQVPNWVVNREWYFLHLKSRTKKLTHFIYPFYMTHGTTGHKCVSWNGSPLPKFERRRINITLRRAVLGNLLTMYKYYSSNEYTMMNDWVSNEASHEQINTFFNWILISFIFVHKIKVSGDLINFVFI